MKSWLISLKRAIAPNHFEVLSQVLVKLIEETAGPIRVLDIGAGSAWYWRVGTLGNLVNSGQIKLSILDPASENELQASLLAERISGKAPSDLVRFKDQSFDAVMAFDVIEHLPRDQGFLLMYQMERLSAHLAVIFTPNGWVWQPPSPNNPFNAHVSGWQPRDFPKNLGWQITGHHGPKWAFGPYGLQKKSFNTHLGRLVLEFLSLTVARIPSAAYAFLAVSNSRNRPTVQSQPNVISALE